MGDFRTPIIDLLRKSADKKAMGPMRYRNVDGHAVPDDERYSAEQALTKLLRTPAKTETLRDRQIREAGG